MTISVVTIAKNIITQGYCFWESLESCLPIMDELIISEGYSTDETMLYLNKFKERHSQIPIVLFQEKWPDMSYHGEAIADVSMSALKRSSKDWILYLQMDEVYHENLISFIKNLNLSKYNSVSFSFYHFLKSWSPSANPSYSEAIRMVRNNSKFSLKGDGWTFEKVEPVCPSKLCPHKVYHFGSVFPKQNDVKDIEHFKLYQNIIEYKERLKNIGKGKSIYPLNSSFGDFPELAKRFIGDAVYNPPYLL